MAAEQTISTWCSQQAPASGSSSVKTRSKSILWRATKILMLWEEKNLLAREWGQDFGGSLKGLTYSFITGLAWVAAPSWVGTGARAACMCSEGAPKGRAMPSTATHPSCTGPERRETPQGDAVAGALTCFGWYNNNNDDYNNKLLTNVTKIPQEAHHSPRTNQKWSC